MIEIIMLLFIYPFLLTVWCIIYRIIDRYNKNFKLSRMNTSAIHALSVIIAYSLNVPAYVIYYWSLTYYIQDSAWELCLLFCHNRTPRIFDLGIILHHVVSIGLVTQLYYKTTESYVYYPLYLAEVSNLPLYLVYHLRGIQYKNLVIMKLLTIVEVIFYMFFRLYCGGLIVYKNYWIETIPDFIKFSSYFMLIFSIIWTTKLIRQLLTP